MKKIVLTLAITALTAAPALADNDIGCGVGTMIFKGKSGALFKILGATTNGSFGNQTFGITTGTLGCQSDGAISSNEKINMFAAANLDKLAKEMAAGEGETLSALAGLYGVTDSDKSAFFSMAKSGYGQIFTSEATTAGDMVSNLNGLMGDSIGLSVYVPKS